MPAISEAIDSGLIAGDEGALRVTNSGLIELEKAIFAFERWLTQELTDHGADVGPEVEREVRRIARELTFSQLTLPDVVASA